MIQSVRRRVLGAFRPAVVPTLLVALALTIVALDLGATSLMGVVFQLVDPKGLQVSLGLHDLGYALLIGPLTGGMVLIAALLPSRLGFRALVLMVLAALMALGLSSCATIPLVDQGGKGEGWSLAFAGLITYGPLFVSALALALGALATVPLYVRRLGVEQAEDAIASRLAEPGWLRVASFAEELGGEAMWLREIAATLVVERAVPIRDDGDFLVHRDRVAASLATILERAQQRGRLSWSDCVDGDVPEELVAAWLEQLALQPDLPLTIDRERREVLWDATAARPEMTWCQRCGGPEQPVGSGIRRCTACGGERLP